MYNNEQGNTRDIYTQDNKGQVKAIGCYGNKQSQNTGTMQLLSTSF